MTEQLADSSGVTREPTMRIRRATPQEEQFGRDLHYLHDNMGTWAAELGPKWVAVYKQERIAVADNLNMLFEQVETQGSPKNLVVIEQLSERV